MKIKKYIAAIVMTLIVLMPVAFAQELQITRWSGDDEINGYIKSEDTLYIEAKAMIPWEDIIGKSQVKACLAESTTPRPCTETTSWQNFDNCVQESGKYYKCTYTKEFDVYNSEVKLQIDLYDDDDRLVKYERKDLVIDALPPIINNFVISPKSTLGPINLAYEVDDYGVNPNTIDKCAGIYEVEFQIDGEPILTDRELVKGVCSKTRGVNYVYTGNKTQVTICAIARDYLGRESVPACDDFVMDEGKPTIDEIVIVDDAGAIITHVKPGATMPVKVRAKITDESQINDSSVEARLDPFTGTANYVSFDEKDEEDDYYYWIYKSPNTRIDVSEGMTGTITVRAKDKVGNQESGTHTFDIKTDDSGPVYIDMTAAAEDNESRPMTTYDSYLAVEFAEKDTQGDAGVGMNLHKAYIDLSSLKMSSDEQAETCENTGGDKWLCKWRITPSLTLDDGVYNVVLKTNTQDDLGNVLASSVEKEIKYQIKGPLEPKVIDYVVIPGPQGVGGEAIRGDTVQFKVQSRDFESAYADFTAIGGTNDTLPIICEYDTTTDTDICTFESLVDITGPAEATVEFFFKDIFDEESTAEYKIDIYELKDDATPNFWAPEVECSPQPIDRKTTSQLPQTIVCQIHLRKLANKKTVSITGPSTLYDCQGNVTGFIDEIRTINNGPESTDPYFMIKLPARDYYLDTLSFTCPLLIYSKSDRYIYANPEEEDIDVELTFYDLPLGEVAANAEKDIRHAVKVARDTHDWIDELDEVLSFAEEFCRWKNVITSIIASLQTVLAIIGEAEDVLTGIPVVGPAAAQGVYLERGPFCEGTEEIDKMYSGTTEGGGLYQILDQACAIVNCQTKGGKEGWGIDTWVGGAAPWCVSLENAFMDLPALKPLVSGYKMSTGWGKKVGEPEGNVRLYQNIKDNIYLSVACLCLPGIIRNVNKLAQIECNYATCLQKEYVEKGIPRSYCTDTKNYLKCAYVTGGPLFDLIPFSQFLDSISVMLGDIFSGNWMALVTTALGGLCDLHCWDKPAAIHTACALARVAAEVGETWASINAMDTAKNDLGGGISKKWCEDMEKWAGEVEVEEEEEDEEYESL